MATFVSDEEFLRTWEQFKSPTKVANALNVSVRGVYERRDRMEKRMGIVLKTVGDVREKNGETNKARLAAERNAEVRATCIENIINSNVANGTVVIFSDAHYWPGEPTVAHTALVKVIKQLKPDLVIANGDLFDGARISRHPRAGWEQRPSVKEEIEVVCLRMREIEKAAKGSQLIRTLGNHDSRFENYIAANAPELEGVHGTSLFDFLPAWRGCWAVHVNPGDDGWTVIRHVHVAGGIHSAYNSTVRAGTHYVHGHLHKLQVTPFGDYRGRRYGVDTGTLADPEGQQFAYTQAGPLNWCSGFAVLTYADGRLLIPELVEVLHGQAWFRGATV
jgi:hypothetical protein